MKCKPVQVPAPTVLRTGHALRSAIYATCLIGMEACVRAHHLSHKLKALGHDTRLMPAR